MISRTDLPMRESDRIEGGRDPRQLPCTLHELDRNARQMEQTSMDRPPQAEPGESANHRSTERELGQTMAEYTVTLTVITIAILAGIIAISDQAAAQFERIAEFLP